MEVQCKRDIYRIYIQQIYFSINTKAGSIHSIQEHFPVWTESEFINLLWCDDCDRSAVISDDIKNTPDLHFEAMTIFQLSSRKFCLLHPKNQFFRQLRALSKSKSHEVYEVFIHCKGNKVILHYEKNNKVLI